MKTLLIITGPQGSGNHLWSKVFAASAEVYGWSELNNTYWIPHADEPFAAAWDNTTKLSDIEFDKFAVTSISCPYAKDGSAVEPNYASFVNEAERLGYKVRLAIIGRDQNVLQYQQQRVRGTHSYKRFEQHLAYLCGLNPVFISTELLYLYRMNYLRSLDLGVPINITEEKLNEILVQDPNSKYFIPAEPQELDILVKHVSGLL